MKRWLPLMMALTCASSFAGPGDVFVPAHLTRNGSFVPPNVPPSSGGTYRARGPGRSRAGAQSAPRRAGLTSPLLATARPLQR